MDLIPAFPTLKRVSLIKEAIPCLLFPSLLICIPQDKTVEILPLLLSSVFTAAITHALSRIHSLNSSSIPFATSPSAFVYIIFSLIYSPFKIPHLYVVVVGLFHPFASSVVSRFFSFCLYSLLFFPSFLGLSCLMNTLLNSILF